MATIEDLNRSISEMTDDEIMTMLRDLRSARRAVSTPRPRKATPKVSPDSVTSLLNALSNDELATLLAELEES